MQPRMKFVLTCRELTEYATDAMEGTLPMRTRVAVRLHLLACRMCRTYLAQLRQTAGLLHGRSLPAPPAEVETRIVERAKPEG